MPDERYDAVVVGCGPAGSTVGGRLAARGHSVLMIDREPFPRYHIGESLTGTVGAYLREAGLESELDGRGFPTKYGVKVIGKDARNEFFVAAAPKPTWQVRRDEFDRLLLDRAVERGAEYLQATARAPVRDGDRVTGVEVLGDGEESKIDCGFLVDASGLGTYLSRQGVAGPRVEGQSAGQISFFSQLEGCERDPGLMAGNTIIFYREANHWAWFIPLDEERVSVGIVVTASTYRRLRERARSEGVAIPDYVFSWGIERLNPDLKRRCGGRPRCEEVRVIRDYSYEIRPFAGDGWICVGDSHRFIDPIFSFGVSVAIEEGKLAAAAIDRVLGGEPFAEPLTDYQRTCAIGQDAVADVVRYFWRFPAFFGAQTQGIHRDDIMKLFAGACYDEVPLRALQMMRESLAAVEAAP